MRKFLIVIEKADGNYSAYSPDLPGCVATGSTTDEVKRNMQEAIEMHLAGLTAEKQTIPKGRAFTEYYERIVRGIKWQN